MPKVVILAGRIGAIKALEHLRSVLSHVGALVLPDPISIARSLGLRSGGLLSVQVSG